MISIFLFHRHSLAPTLLPITQRATKLPRHQITKAPLYHQCASLKVIIDNIAAPSAYAGPIDILLALMIYCWPVVHIYLAI